MLDGTASTIDEIFCALFNRLSFFFLFILGDEYEAGKAATEVVRNRSYDQRWYATRSSPVTSSGRS